uniref:Uncharacterized protein n=1 Tax=Meloidogyne incognita TaxID=6306 RepID=A0A914NF47_MELIC
MASPCYICLSTKGADFNIYARSGFRLSNFRYLLALVNDYSPLIIYLIPMC